MGWTNFLEVYKDLSEVNFIKCNIFCTEMGSDLFPEKFAMYFASMNPLASKIYSDIEGIEDYIKAHNPSAISYGEKCSIVDKFLIYDHLNKHDANGKLNKRLSDYQRWQIQNSNSRSKSDSTSVNSNSSNRLIDKEEDHGLISETELVHPVYYNDACLDQDHESVLLTSVAPKKPEKYVYDDNNYWIDEHSATYSSCTLGQAKACKLDQFLAALPPPATVKPHHHHKYRAPPIPTTFKTNSQEEVEEDDPEDEDAPYIVTSRKTSKSGIEDDEGRYSKIDRMVDSEKSKAKYSVGVPLFGGLFGGDALPPSTVSQKKSEHDTSASAAGVQDLPNQVKNTDLIAELQAKLRKGKGPSTPEGISPRSSTKVIIFWNLIFSLL